MRFTLPRWIAYTTLGFVAATAVSVVGLSGEHALLVQQWAQTAALRRRVADQRKVIDTFQTRVASVRGEIDRWRTAHTKMWHAFTPEGATGEAKTAAAGDGAPTDPSATAGAKPRPQQELELLASAVAEESPRVEQLEHVVSRTGKMVSALPLHWPINGPVRSEFGMRKSPWTGEPERHLGIDIGSPPGTLVKSPAPGKVLVASTGGGFGKKVTIDHGNGVRSLYGHMRKLDVKSGQKVEKGQVIGEVGSTGRSTGPHLHYEVLVQGKPVNPRGFLLER